jgi:hypothetical protein
VLPARWLAAGLPEPEGFRGLCRARRFAAGQPIRELSIRAFVFLGPGEGTPADPTTARDSSGPPLTADICRGRARVSGRPFPFSCRSPTCSPAGQCRRGQRPCRGRRSRHLRAGGLYGSSAINTPGDAVFVTEPGHGELTERSSRTRGARGAAAQVPDSSPLRTSPWPAGCRCSAA